MRTLVRKRKNDPVLVGESGVGKTAIAEGLAQLMATGRVPAELKSARMVELPIAALVAGTTCRGQFEERLLKLVDEIQRAGDVILFIDEITRFFGPEPWKEDRWMRATSSSQPWLAGMCGLRCCGGRSRRAATSRVETMPAIDKQKAQREELLTKLERCEATFARLLPAE